MSNVNVGRSGIASLLAFGGLLSIPGVSFGGEIRAPDSPPPPQRRSKRRSRRPSGYRYKPHQSVREIQRRARGPHLDPVPCRKWFVISRMYLPEGETASLGFRKRKDAVRWMRKFIPPMPEFTVELKYSIYS